MKLAVPLLAVGLFFWGGSAHKLKSTSKKCSSDCCVWGQSQECPRYKILGDYECPNGCSESVCCDLLEVCTSKKNSEFCSDSAQILDPSQLCSGTDEASCTEAQCCVDRIKCAEVADEMSCVNPAGVDQRFMANYLCSGTTVDSCTVDDCCEDLATCQHFPALACGQNQVLLREKTCPGVHDHDCDPSVCCADKVSCPGFACSNGTVNNTAFCKGSIPESCSPEDCCVMPN